MAKQVRFYRKGTVVIESACQPLMYHGKPWPPANWSGTEEALETLQKENPDVEFVEVDPPR